MLCSEGGLCRSTFNLVYLHPLLTVTAPATSGRPCVTSGQKHTGPKITSFPGSRAGCEHGLGRLRSCDSRTTSYVTETCSVSVAGFVSLIDQGKYSGLWRPSICNGSHWAPALSAVISHSPISGLLTVGRMSGAHVAHICELATSRSSRAGTYQRHGYSAFSSKSEMGSLCNPHLPCTKSRLGCRTNVTTMDCSDQWTPHGRPHTFGEGNGHKGKERPAARDMNMHITHETTMAMFRGQSCVVAADASIV